jgi:hypothetical protein
LTIVLEWSSADTGVGATMAPVSLDENGNCADFTNPAKAKHGRKEDQPFVETQQLVKFHYLGGSVPVDNAAKTTRRSGSVQRPECAVP